MFCYSDTALQLLRETVEREEQNILVEIAAAKEERSSLSLSLSLTAVLSSRNLCSSFSDPVGKTAGRAGLVVWRLMAAIIRPAVNSSSLFQSLLPAAVEQERPG